MKRLAFLVICFTLIASVAFSATTYVGSSSSNKYHYTTCKWAQKILPENLVTFNSPEEAMKSGYMPCKVCKPPMKSK